MNIQTSQHIRMIASLTTCKIKTTENQAIRAKRIRAVKKEIEGLREFAALKSGAVAENCNDLADTIEAALHAASGE